jgi:hypothetical protein
MRKASHNAAIKTNHYLEKIIDGLKEVLNCKS